MRQDLVLILKLYLKHGIRQRLKDSCHYLNRVFLRQSVSRFRLPSAGFASNSLRQNDSTIGRHSNRVLKMCAQTSVFRYRGPTITQHLHARLA